MNFLLFGRPNVGKSSIYNILTGQKKNIIHIEGIKLMTGNGALHGFNKIK